MDPQTLALTLERKLLDGFRLSNPKYSPAHMCEVIQSCWHAVPDKRPTFSYIKLDFEKHYNLQDCFIEDNVVQDASDKSHTQLKYAELLLQENILKTQFQKISQCNST